MNEIVTYQQLTLLPRDQLTEPQKEFLNLHAEMVLAGAKAAECFLIVANDLKRMRDEELYKEAGFEKFEDYVETALNIRERQARKWISILKLPEEYLTKNAGMGVTKLAAIASASEEVATDLMEDETTVSKSSRELSAIIRQKEEELAEKDRQVNDLENDLQNKADRIRELEEELEIMDNVDADTDISEYENKIAALTAELEDVKNNLDDAESRLSEKEAEIEELSGKAPEVVTETIEKTVEVENPETKKALEEAIKAAEAAKKEKAEFAEKAEQYQAELSAYKKAQETVATFKIHAATLFGTWDSVVQAVKLIGITDAALAAKCVQKLNDFIEVVQNDMEELSK